MINEEAFVNEYKEVLAKVRMENKIALDNPDAALSVDALKLMLSRAIVELKPEVASNPKKAAVYAKLVDMYSRLQGFTKDKIEITGGPEAWAKAIQERSN